jgi:hypothetical protein
MGGKESRPSAQTVTDKEPATTRNGEHLWHLYNLLSSRRPKRMR